ncbi:MAG: hypothetical protein NVS2B7_23210 [Herpetosiphon sp.]
MQSRPTAVNLLTRTMPFLWTRLGVYLLFGLAMAIYLGIAFGVAYILYKLIPLVGIIFFIIAYGAVVPIYRLAENYFFYLLKAAHVAVMTEILVRGDLPPGSNQIEWGKQAVLSRFRDTSIMFGVNQLVSGVVRVVTNSVANIMNFLPIPDIDVLSRFITLLVNYSTKYIDMAVLSRAYMTNEPNVWATASEGVVLYAQAWKPILKNSVWLAALSFGSFVIAMIVLGIPALVLALILPKLLVFAIVVIMALMLKVGVGDTYALASTLITYHANTASMVASPEWTARLNGLSDKFKQLQTNAASFTQTPHTAAPAESLAVHS